tara:strand:- start:748 stop:1233 length:486 start_codon:yes stop_codon:yes gene_type:complete
MELLNTHSHQLIFRIHNDTSKEYMKRWSEFKFKCENGNNKQIIEQIKGYCKLESNKNVQYLEWGDRVSVQYNTYKQIRFRNYFKEMCLRSRQVRDDCCCSGSCDNDIRFNDIYSKDSEKWTYHELDDLIYGFIKTANYYIHEHDTCKCSLGVSGSIEMRKK